MTTTMTPTAGPATRVKRAKAVATTENFGIRQGPGWSTVSFAPGTAGADLGGLGHPGLWKRNGDQLNFEIPLNIVNGVVLDGDDDDGQSSAPLPLCHAWAKDTAFGQVPPDWAPPPQAEVESWIAPGGLSVVDRAIARQGKLHYRPNRLAISVPVVTSLPRGLSASRRRWLETLLADAQSMWRMVRFGIDERTNSALAEIDLSGAPIPVLEPLFRFALDALNLATCWVLAPAALIVSATTARALDGFPERQ